MNSGHGGPRAFTCIARIPQAVLMAGIAPPIRNAQHTDRERWNTETSSPIRLDARGVKE